MKHMDAAYQSTDHNVHEIQHCILKAMHADGTYMACIMEGPEDGHVRGKQVPEHTQCGSRPCKFSWQVYLWSQSLSCSCVQLMLGAQLNNAVQVAHASSSNLLPTWTHIVPGT